MSVSFGEAGKQTILVVDDDESIRELLTKVLTECGYGVVTANDGQEAVEIYLEKYKEINLVLMDVSMGALDGFEAQYKMHSFNPYAKVLLMSGYPLECLAELDSPRFIRKPFSPDLLHATIRNFLDNT